MAQSAYSQKINKLVESVRAFQLAEVGSKEWLEVHYAFIKLGRQAENEGDSFREKKVKAIFIERDKLDIVVHEAYCILLWKTRVLPHLIEFNPDHTAVSAICDVLLHESAVVSLLDNLLYTACDCQALWDCAADLVDYCAKSLIQFIDLTRMDANRLGSDEISTLEHRMRVLIRRIALRCISIITFLAVNAQFLPLNAARRMVVVHDIPRLIVDLLHKRPWFRRIETGPQVFMNDQWVDYHGDKIAKYEAASWICLRELLFNQSLMEVYDLNDERVKYFGKCYSIMNDNLIIELPKLDQLKNYFQRLVESRELPERSTFALPLEEESHIYEKLIKEAEQAGGYFEIAQQQKKFLFDPPKCLEHCFSSIN